MTSDGAVDGIVALRPTHVVHANAAWEALGLPTLRPWDSALRDRLAHW